MPHTIIEQIIQAHSDEPVEAGRIVWMRLDARTARDFGGANVVKNYKAHYGDSPVDDRARTFFTFDLVTPANNIPYAVNQQICRDWARAQGVPDGDLPPVPKAIIEPPPLPPPESSLKDTRKGRSPKRTKAKSKSKSKSKTKGRARAKAQDETQTEGKALKKLKKQALPMTGY